MALTVSTGVLGQLIGSLLQQGDNIIEQLVFKKVEELGKDVIKDLVRSTPLGAGIRAAGKFQSWTGGGPSNFKQERDQWLNSLVEPSKKPGTGSRLSKKIQEAFDKVVNAKPEGSKKNKWDWYNSRKDWLSNEGWQHDWRSQPRNLAGRWIKGRLNYIYVARGNASKKVRSVRRREARRRIKWNPKTGNYE